MQKDPSKCSDCGVGIPPICPICKAKKEPPKQGGGPEEDTSTEKSTNCVNTTSDAQDPAAVIYPNQVQLNAPSIAAIGEALSSATSGEGANDDARSEKGIRLGAKGSHNADEANNTEGQEQTATSTPRPTPSCAAGQ